MSKNKIKGLSQSQINLTKAFESIFNVGKDVFPQKHFDGGPPGGPLDPPKTLVESTYVQAQPLRIPMTVSDLTTAQKIDIQRTEARDTRLQNVGQPGFTIEDFKNTLPMALGSSGKVKSKDRYREKSFGGNAAMHQAQEESQGLNTMASVVENVPVLGQLFGGALRTIGGLNEQSAQEKFEHIQPMRINTNIYGQQAMGGLITKNFKQYNTGSHTSRQDLPIDGQGNANHSAEGGYVQNQENAYTFKDNSAYIMSDTLINPETGNLFNQDAAKLNKRYSKADSIPEEQNAIEYGMQRLSKLNDHMRNLKDSVLKACGGSTKKTMESGGDPVDPRFSYTVNNDTTPLETFNEGLPYNTGMLNQPIPTFTLVPQDIATDNSSVISNPQFTPGAELRSENANPSVTKTRSSNSMNMNYNTVAMALKGLALGKSIADAATDPEKEKVILPNYSKSDKQMYMANADYTQARQDAVAAANIGSNVNRSASSNFASYQGRQANNFANLADQLGRISMQENNQRAGQAFARGQYETSKAVDTANRRYQNRIDNQQNQATADLADQKLFSELSQIGSEFNNYQYYKDQLKNNKELTEMKIKESAQILGGKYDNFGFSKEFIDKISKGDYKDLDFDQVIQFISTADQVKKVKKG